MMRIGLAVYGTVFSMGIHPASGRPAIRPQQLMDQALAAGLEGVELPVSLLQGENVTAVARYAQERKLFITLAAGGYDPDKLSEAIDLGAQLGASTVRTAVGGAKIGGGRRAFGSRWQWFFYEVPVGGREGTGVDGRVDVDLAGGGDQSLG